MKNVIILNKKEGETPLGCLERFRRKNKVYKDTPMTYAGRLDPMASGLLIILAGEECKKKEKYLNLDKEYEFSVLFGFATDTYDILGKVTARQPARNAKSIAFVGGDLAEDGMEKKIKENIKYFKGKIIQKYPVYSSRTVAGKPLFEYARSGEAVEIPEREVIIKELKLKNIKKISKEKLLINIEKRINKVKGDFRQKEILRIWQKNLMKTPSNFLIADFVTKCSSGTYVRSVANSLGERIGVPALALSIKRTKIGKHKKLS